MPREGRSVVSVHEVSQVAAKSLIQNDETPYNSYDDLLREVVLNSPYRDIVNDELLKAVEDGRMKMVDVLDKIEVTGPDSVPEDIPVEEYQKHG